MQGIQALVVPLPSVWLRVTSCPRARASAGRGWVDTSSNWRSGGQHGVPVGVSSVNAQPNTRQFGSSRRVWGLRVASNAVEEKTSTEATSSPGASTETIEREEDGKKDGPVWKVMKVLLPILGFVILGTIGYAGVSNKDALRHFLEHFTDVVDEWGFMGYVAYVLLYAGLEVLALPAIPLTMTAGALFGVAPGTITVSVAATLGATISFLISRYLARDRVLELAKGNKQFMAMDRAISKDGFKVVTLLRLSPLLPFALSNYLYGLTSVDVTSYVAGSWLGMLPGTLAYVLAGSYGKDVLLAGGQHRGPEMWQVLLVGGFTVAVLGYIGRLAKVAMTEIEAELDQK